MPAPGERIIFNDFTVMPDGPIRTGDKLTSGHTWAVAGDGAAQLFSVVRGEARQGGGIPDNWGNAYLHCDAKKPIKEIALDFVFHAGAVDGVFGTVITGDDNFDLHNLLHAIFYRDSWALQVRRSETGLKLPVRGSGKYFSPMEGGKTYQVRMSADPANNTVYLKLPDGQTVSVTHPDIDDQVCGNRCYWQVIHSGAGQDDYGLLRTSAYAAKGK